MLLPRPPSYHANQFTYLKSRYVGHTKAIAECEAKLPEYYETLAEYKQHRATLAERGFVVAEGIELLRLIDREILGGDGITLVRGNARFCAGAGGLGG